MTINILIADDEALARDELSYLLSKWEDIHIIGEAKDGEEALEKILELEPDVAFLDIQMPIINGINVAKKAIKYHTKSMFVFATAYDQHAIQAFEINAIDYLLKPFDDERVKMTVERIKDKKEQQDPQMLTKVLEGMMGEQRPQSNVSKLAVQKEESVILLDPSEIMYAFREEREVQVKTFADTYTTKYTLQTLEDKLTKYPFFRTHRSYLVNLHHVQEMIPWFNGAYNLTMKDQEKSKVPVSRAYVKALKEVLEL